MPISNKIIQHQHNSWKKNMDSEKKKTALSSSKSKHFYTLVWKIASSERFAAVRRLANREKLCVPFGAKRDVENGDFLECPILLIRVSGQVVVSEVQRRQHTKPNKNTNWKKPQPVFLFFLKTSTSPTPPTTTLKKNSREEDAPRNASFSHHCIWKISLLSFCDRTATLQQKEWTFDGILSAMGYKDETKISQLQIVEFHTTDCGGIWY